MPAADPNGTADPTPAARAAEPELPEWRLPADRDGGMCDAPGNVALTALGMLVVSVGGVVISFALADGWGVIPWVFGFGVVGTLGVILLLVALIIVIACAASGATAE